MAMQKTPLILDFDQCLFDHGREDFLYGLSTAYADAVAETNALPFAHEDIYQKVSHAFQTQGMQAFTYDDFLFKEYGLDPKALYVRAFEIFLKKHVTEDDIKHMQAQGAHYVPLLSNADLDIAIVSNSPQGYVSKILEVMGIKHLISDERIIGLDTANMNLKENSDAGFQMALSRLHITNPQAAYYADDRVEDLTTAFNAGLQTIHITKTAQAHPCICHTSDTLTDWMHFMRHYTCLNKALTF